MIQSRNDQFLDVPGHEYGNHCLVPPALVSSTHAIFRLKTPKKSNWERFQIHLWMTVKQP